MEADSFYNMGNENFTLDGYKCSVRSYPLDEEEEGIAVTPKLDEPLRYAFSGMNGLCITTQYGSVLETDLLGKFLSALSNADEMEHPNHYDFVKEYGFFFPIREDDRFVISRHSFQNICNRLK